MKNIFLRRDIHKKLKTKIIKKGTIFFSKNDPAVKRTIRPGQEHSYRREKEGTHESLNPSNPGSERLG